VENCDLYHLEIKSEVLNLKTIRKVRILEMITIFELLSSHLMWVVGEA
jgi:hypothetical protein